MLTYNAEQKNEHFIYLIMDFCSGGDLSIYIRKRGKLASLDYHLPDSSGRTEGQMVFWPHPAVGGLDDFVVRNFLGQLGRFALEGHIWKAAQTIQSLHCSGSTQVSPSKESDSS